MRRSGLESPRDATVVPSCHGAVVAGSGAGGRDVRSARGGRLRWRHGDRFWRCRRPRGWRRRSVDRGDFGWSGREQRRRWRGRRDRFRRYDRRIVVGRCRRWAARTLGSGSHHRVWRLGRILRGRVVGVDRPGDRRFGRVHVLGGHHRSVDVRRPAGLHLAGRGGDLGRHAFRDARSQRRGQPQHGRRPQHVAVDCAVRAVRAGGARLVRFGVRRRRRAGEDRDVAGRRDLDGPDLRDDRHAGGGRLDRSPVLRSGLDGDDRRLTRRHELDGAARRPRRDDLRGSGLVRFALRPGGQPLHADLHRRQDLDRVRLHAGADDRRLVAHAGPVRGAGQRGGRPSPAPTA
jgi:hypothetical protein